MRSYCTQVARHTCWVFRTAGIERQQRDQARSQRDCAEPCCATNTEHNIRYGAGGRVSTPHSLSFGGPDPKHVFAFGTGRSQRVRFELRPLSRLHLGPGRRRVSNVFTLLMQSVEWPTERFLFRALNPDCESVLRASVTFCRAPSQWVTTRPPVFRLSIWVQVSGNSPSISSSPQSEVAVYPFGSRCQARAAEKTRELSMDGRHQDSAVD